MKKFRAAASGKGRRSCAALWKVLIFPLALTISPPLTNTVYPQIGLPPAIDPSGRSGLPPPVQKKAPLAPEKVPEEILPPVQPSPPEPLEKGPVLRAFVKKINVVGSTVLSQEELDQLTTPYENREVTTEDLEDIRRQITLIYVNKGYPNSGAIIPDQAVADQTITLQVIEGQLSDIRVQGTKWFRPSYFKDRIGLSAGPPFNMNPLRDRLQVLLQDDRVERLNAELKPGAALGEAILDVDVQEANPFRAFVEYNNYINPTVGENQLRGTIVHRNLTGHGDVLSVSFGSSAQASPYKVGVFPNLDASYALPLNKYDTTFFAGYRLFNFKVVEDPFRPLDIESETQIFTLSLRQPVYRTLNDEVAIASSVSTSRMPIHCLARHSTSSPVCEMDSAMSLRYVSYRSGLIVRLNPYSQSARVFPQASMCSAPLSMQLLERPTASSFHGWDKPNG